MLLAIKLNVVNLNFVMLNVSFMLLAIQMNVAILNFVMLNVIMMHAIMLKVDILHEFGYGVCCYSECCCNAAYC